MKEKEFNLKEELWKIQKRYNTGEGIRNIFSIMRKVNKEFIRLLKSPKHTMKNAEAEDGSKFILISYNELDKLSGGL